MSAGVAGHGWGGQGSAAVTPQLVVTCDLARREQGTHFQVGCEVDGAQLALQHLNQFRLRDHASRHDGYSLELAIRRALSFDQLGAQRPGGSLHPFK